MSLVSKLFYGNVIRHDMCALLTGILIKQQIFVYVISNYNVNDGNEILYQKYLYCCDRYILFSLYIDSMDECGKQLKYLI